MTWPTDNLTNARTDNPTDRPDLARAELNALILKVQAILAEAPAGSLLLTNQDEGAGNGLDADTVDGENASAFANASHNHSAADITGGILTVPRGGTGRGSLTNFAVLLGNLTSEVNFATPSSDGTVLMSNAAGTAPTFQALPTQPTVDVHASDFYETEISATGGSGTFDEIIDTGFGTDAFVYGVSGIRRTDGSADTINSGGIYDNEGFSLNLSGDGTVAAAADNSPGGAGKLRVVFAYAAGGSLSFRVKVWARKDL